MKNIEYKNKKGITLIALIITIIIMLILTGIILSLTIGENGLLKISRYAVQKDSEAKAKEKLELALADLQANKYTDDYYNENKYIDDYLKNKDITVAENVVTVDNWNFEIDRSIPSIKANLGESEVRLTKEIKEYLGKDKNGKYLVVVSVKIESNKKIESIEFENVDNTKLTLATEKNVLVKDMQIELDKEYKITIRIANGRTETRIIMEKSQENIRTVEELLAFRDKVNTGLTYEGKTVNLLEDIDLSKVCYEVDGTIENDKSWEPIGNYGTDNTHIFKGIFNGNYHKIDGLYINSDKKCQGLFGYVQNGTITGLVIEGIEDKKSTEENVKIISIRGNNWYIGAVVGYCENTTVNRCVNKAYVKGNNSLWCGGIVGFKQNGSVEECYNIANIQSNKAGVGGICGRNQSGTIKNCYSIGEVTSLGHEDNNHSQTGGIVGGNVYNSTIENVYHIGQVTAKYSYVGGIVGYNGNSSAGKQTVKNVFNVGTVKYGSNVATSNIGSGLGTLIGRYQTLTGKYGNISEDTIKGWDEETIKTNFGESFTKDINNINDGYPILKWQIEKK